jgi:hypothetical protein
MGRDFAALVGSSRRHWSSHLDEPGASWRSHPALPHSDPPSLGCFARSTGSHRWVRPNGAGNVPVVLGGVAQLVERLTGSQEVRGFESLRLHSKSQVRALWSGIFRARSYYLGSCVSNRDGPGWIGANDDGRTENERGRLPLPTEVRRPVVQLKRRTVSATTKYAARLKSRPLVTYVPLIVRSTMPSFLLER